MVCLPVVRPGEESNDLKRVRGTVEAGILLVVLLLAAGCGSSGSGGPASTGRGAPSSPRCESGTLGMETVALSRQLRKELALSDDFQGAVVSEVFPGGPASAAGVQPDDIVEQVESSRITNDCDFVSAGYSRACEPVRIVLRRAGAALEVTVVPVDQEAFLEERCREGIPSACFRRAWSFWNRNQGIDRQYALELYETACQAGSAEACASAGHNLMASPDRAKDAIALLERSCELRSGAGCAHLAFLSATGKLAKKDDRRATQLYVRSCDLGDALGCYNVGLMAEQGRGGARNFSRAVAKYDEACAAGSSTACTNLGFLYEKGTGVKKDGARAVALYQRGCDGTRCQPSNLGGCLNVGRAYRDGIGVERDPKRAASIFQPACDREPPPEDVGAEENRSRACSLLGALYLAGHGVEKDPGKGRELSELGCERGDAFGCFNAAVTEPDPARAASFLDRACQAGDGEGCHDLGVAYEKGSGVARDRRRAAELLRKACQLGFAKACGKKR